MKVFCAALVHESNSFSPIPTNAESYYSFYRSGRDGKTPDMDLDPAPESMVPLAVKARGHQLVLGLHASASPSAPTARADYEAFRSELLVDLKKAMPVDFVAMFLHGAQIAEGYPDCEGDIIRRVREIVGPGVPIGVELDLHCNITDEMTENATAILACKEYPHTDFNERAFELIEILETTIEGQTLPVMSFQRVPMFGIFHTTREPLRSFVDELMAMEASDPDVLSISLAHGFPYGDCPYAGAGVLVITNDKRDKGDILAQDLAERFFGMREAISAPVISVEQALDEAAGISNGTVVIADTTDNAGGGAASDSTVMLKAMLERKIESAAIGMFWDPIAVELAKRAGVGATFPLRLGGKIGPMSGDPLDVVAKVTAIRDDGHQTMFGAPAPLGSAVALDIDGLAVVVSSHREQVHDPACFSELGIDPWSKRLLVVKSAQHFHALFSKHASHIIYADPPGTVTSDFTSLPHQTITRPIWPVDATPFDAFGKSWG